MRLSDIKILLAMYILLVLQACNINTLDTNSEYSNESVNNSSDSFIKSMREKQMETYYLQASLTQLHRWYQYYEHPQASIKNQLDILSDDVIVSSSLGTARGHAQYAKAVQAIPNHWKNAHFVKQSSIHVTSNSNVKMQATITYLNHGRSASNDISQASIDYDMHLQPNASLLPKFTNINITPTQGKNLDTFVDAYAENRLKSLMYYWLAIVEHPDRQSEPAHEILDSNFSLNFSSGTISDLDALREWFAGPASSVVFTSHTPENFSYQKLSENNYVLSVDFDWNGTLPNTKSMTARTKHTWQVVDNPLNRFAKIKSMDVEILKPFTVAE